MTTLEEISQLLLKETMKLHTYVFDSQKDYQLYDHGFVPRENVQPLPLMYISDFRLETG